MSISINNNLASLGKKSGYKPIYVAATDGITAAGSNYDTFSIGHSGGGSYFVRMVSTTSSSVVNPNYAVTIVWIKIS